MNPSNKKKIPTANKMGFMHVHPNPASDAFFEAVKQTKGRFIDIGAAYGYYTLEALSLGAQILAIDLEEKHIDALNEACPDGYKGRLTTQVASFPDEVVLTPNTFDGVLLSRLFIFLEGAQIERGLSKVYDCLMPGGRFL